MKFTRFRDGAAIFAALFCFPEPSCTDMYGRRPLKGRSPARGDSRQERRGASDRGVDAGRDIRRHVAPWNSRNQSNLKYYHLETGS